MIDLTRLIIIPLVAMSVAIAGCDKHDHSDGHGHATGHAGNTDPGHHDDDHGNDDHHDDDGHHANDDHHDDADHHGNGGHHDNDDPGTDPGADSGHGHDDDHAATSDFSHTIDVAGAILSMDIEGGPKPKAEIHVEIHHAGGLMPESIRLWYGPRSGEGALKTKADGHDDHWHAHVECPGTITDQDSLWVEVEDADGNRVAKGIKL